MIPEANRPLIVRQTQRVKAIRANWMRSMLFVSLSVVLGVANWVGGPDRWLGESWAVARQMPGSPYTWAVALIVFSSVFGIGAYQQYKNDLAGIQRRHWLLITGAVLCSGWNFALGWCIWWQITIDPTEISYNGPIIWMWLGIMWALKAAFDV